MGRGCRANAPLTEYALHSYRSSVAPTTPSPQRSPPCSTPARADRRLEALQPLRQVRLAAGKRGGQQQAGGVPYDFERLQGAAATEAQVGAGKEPVCRKQPQRRRPAAGGSCVTTRRAGVGRDRCALAVMRKRLASSRGRLEADRSPTRATALPAGDQARATTSWDHTLSMPSRLARKATVVSSTSPDCPLAAMLGLFAAVATRRKLPEPRGSGLRPSVVGTVSTPPPRRAAACRGQHERLAPCGHSTLRCHWCASLAA